MNDQHDRQNAIIPHEPDAIIPAPLVRAVQKAAPVAGGALLMWAGRRALDAFAAYRQRRAAPDIEIHLPDRQAKRQHRPVKQNTDIAPPKGGYTVEVHYSARWFVARRPRRD